MRIATWNVNSVNARLETVLRWFEEAKPDVACLQEIKCVDEKFPAEAFERLGYNVAVHGQKTYNGVAMLSKTPLEDVRKGLPGDDGDDHARYIEAVVSGPNLVRVASIYLPNGNPVEDAAGGRPQGAARRRWRRPCALYRGGGFRAESGPGRLHLPAQWQSCRRRRWRTSARGCPATMATTMRAI